MSSLKKLAGQTAIYGVSSIIGRFVNWGLTPLYTNLFLENDYGVLTDLYAYTTYFLVILTFGMETAFFRFAMDKKDYRDPYKHAFVFTGGMAVTFFLLISLNYRLFARILDFESQPYLILLVAGIILLDVLAAMPMAKLRHEEKAKKFAIISLTNIGINVSLNLFFILVLRKGVEYVFISNLIASAVKLGMALPGSLPHNWKLNNKMVKGMAGFGFYIMLAGLMGMLNQNADKNLIPRLWPECQEYMGEERTGHAMLGLYSAGYKLAMLILLATQAFRYAAEPFFFRHAKESGSRLIFARVFHYYWLLSMAVFVFVSLFRYEVAYFFIGENYWVGLSVVPLLLIAYALLGAYTNFSIWFKLTKQTRFGILFSGVGAFVVLIGNVLTVPWLGFLGSAWAAVISFGLMCVLVYFFGQKYYRIPYRLDRSLVYLGIALGFYFMASFVDPGFLGKLLFFVLFAGVCGALEYFKPIQWKDAQFEKPVPNAPATRNRNRPDSSANVIRNEPRDESKDDTPPQE